MVVRGRLSAMADSDDALIYASAGELVAELRSGKLSSVELLDAYLARVDERDGALNAVVATDVDRARAEAAAADDAACRGESLGPLHGLPMTVKDAFETEGLVTTSGSPSLADHVPAADADAVARLRAAGAVIYGKTNLPLFAGDLQTFNEVYGETHNPWDVSRGPGGSSGGSAAALAAGYTALELGSDIGGSIRNPSHFCGVFGLKPTYDVVPVRGHIPPMPGSDWVPDVGVVGPMARSVDDLELAFDVLAGPSGAAAKAYRLDLPPARATDLGGFRMATWLDDPDAGPVAREVADVLGAAVDRLAAAGARFVDADRPSTWADLGVQFEEAVWGAVGASSADDESWPMLLDFAKASPPTGGSTLERSPRYITKSFRDHIRFEDRAMKTRRAWDGYFGDVDVLLAPVIGVAAFVQQTDATDAIAVMLRTVDLDGRDALIMELTHWAGVFGVLHVPVVVVPAGRTASGLPVGMQVVAGRFEDRTALTAARAISEVLGPFEPPPGYA
jgi:amidase